MKRAAIAVVVLLALVIAGAAAWVASLDPNRYKPEISAQVEAATGRALAIDGDLEIAISLTPAIVVEGLRLANAQWGSEPSMLGVARLEAEVAVLPLLSGEVRIGRIVLIEPHLVLEVGEDGRANWALSGGASETAPSDRGLPALAISELRVEDARVRYRDARTGVDHELRIARLVARADAVDAPIALELEADFAGTPLRVAGEVGSLGALTADRAFDLALSGSVADIGVEVAGTLERPLSAGPVSLDVGVEAQSTAPLAALVPGLTEVLPELGPVKASARVEAAAPRYALRGLAIAAGESDVAGDAEVSLADARPSIAATLRSKRLDLDALAPAGGDAARASDGRAIPMIELPVAGLRAADVDATLAVERLRVGGLELEAVELDAKLVAGRLSLAPRGGFAGGRIDGELVVDAGAAPPTVDARVDARDLDGGRTFAAFGARDLIDGGRGALAVDVRGSGADTRAVAASLDGRVLATLEDARLRGDALDVAGGDAATQLVRLINPAAGEEESVLRCAVVRFDVEDGVARTDRGIALETDRMTAVGSGTIDLGTEALDLGIKPVPREGLGFGAGSLAGLVRLGGTLADPQPGADAKGAVTAGASVGAAVMTGGLSLLAQGLFNRVSADPAPCATALGEKAPPPKRDAAEAAAPAQPEQSVPDRAIEGAKKAAEGIGGAIRGLFGD